jgi:Small primase-like proteins (Toprim domain)
MVNGSGTDAPNPGKSQSRLAVAYPVIVEGKYDKIKLDSILDANIIVTDGFGVFRGCEKAALIRRAAERAGVIVLTDSDSAGLLIRNYINSILPKEKIIHLYTPEVAGRERRKRVGSKSGLLGVEGIDAELLRALFLPYSEGYVEPGAPRRGDITKLDLFEDGLSGGDGSAVRRITLARACGLPSVLSSNALLTALNMLYSRDEYKRIVKELNGQDRQAL